MALFSAIAASLTPFTARPAAHDITIRRLLAARFVTLGRCAPRRLRMIPLGAPLAATVRMVHRIHRDAAHMAALAEPTTASRLADRDIFELEITDLPDCRTALRLHHPLLPRRQLEQRELPLFGH